jgi:hypothetical protein
MSTCVDKLGLHARMDHKAAMDACMQYRISVLHVEYVKCSTMLDRHTPHDYVRPAKFVPSISSFYSNSSILPYQCIFFVILSSNIMPESDRSAQSPDETFHDEVSAPWNRSKADPSYKYRSIAIVSTIAGYFLFAYDNTVIANIRPQIVEDLGGIEDLPIFSVRGPSYMYCIVMYGLTSL